MLIPKLRLSSLGIKFDDQISQLFTQSMHCERVVDRSLVAPPQNKTWICKINFNLITFYDCAMIVYNDASIGNFNGSNDEITRAILK